MSDTESRPARLSQSCTDFSSDIPAAAFPSALSANPALTIMALSLRTADRFLAHAQSPEV